MTGDVVLDEAGEPVLKAFFSFSRKGIVVEMYV